MASGEAVRLKFARVAAIAETFRQSRVVTANLPFLLAIALYTLAVLVASRLFGFTVAMEIYAEFSPFLALTVGAAMLIPATLLTLYKERPQHPIAFVWEKISGKWQVARRIAYAVPVFVVMPYFFSMFTSVKSAIAVMVPFYADPWAAALDHAVHGTDAWRLLQPLLGYPVATMMINFFYNLWFFVAYTALALVAYMVGNDRLRSQYLVAFVLTWVLLGSVLAVALSSAGPCYYAVFYGQDRFADLMAYLREADVQYPIWALGAQNGLLHSYQTSQTGLGAGISALPSLHVAVAALNARLAFHFGRMVGLLATAFALTILVGSVHLGWHYAVDGYLSLILVPVIWWLAGRIADWPLRSLSSPEAN